LATIKRLTDDRYSLVSPAILKFGFMEKQVHASHYDFASYMDKKRWTSVWHQLDEVNRANPRSVLEIGPGPGLLKAVAALYALRVETFDIDPELKRDHLGAAFDMPFARGSREVSRDFRDSLLFK